MEQFQELTLIERGAVKEATDGRKYFQAVFSPGLGQKIVTCNLWQQFKTDSSGAKTAEKYWERGTPEQADAIMASGEKVLGRVVTNTVEPYMIGEGENRREVKKYTTIVFPGQDEVAVFASANHRIVNEQTGEVLGKARLATPAKEDAKEELPVIDASLQK